MRRGFHRSLVLLGAIMLAVLSAGASSALTQTASGVYVYANTDSENVIPVGWLSFKQAAGCAEYHACPHLEDLAFKTVDISAAMQDYETEAQFTSINGLVSQTTYWFVVSYDENRTIDDWWYDDQPSWGLMGELGPDTRELRLFPIHSASTEFHLTVYVN